MLGSGICATLKQEAEQGFKMKKTVLQLFFNSREIKWSMVSHRTSRKNASAFVKTFVTICGAWFLIELTKTIPQLLFNSNNNRGSMVSNRTNRVLALDLNCLYGRVPAVVQTS